MAIPTALTGSQSQSAAPSQTARTSSRSAASTASRSRPSSSAAPSQGPTAFNARSALRQPALRPNTADDLSTGGASSRTDSRSPVASTRAEPTRTSQRLPSSSQSPSHSASASRRVVSDTDRTAATASSARSALGGQSTTLAPLSRTSSSQSTPRLGDTLLRRVSPATGPPPTASAGAGSQPSAPRQASDKVSGQTLGARTGTTSLVASNSSSTQASVSPPPTLMGPPQSRASVGRSSGNAANLRSADQNAGTAPSEGGKRTPRRPVGGRPPSSDTVTTTTVPHLVRDSPPLGDESEEPPLFDESLSGLTPPPRLRPKESALTAAAASPAAQAQQSSSLAPQVGALFDRRPNLRLALDPPQQVPAQPSSRFSAFSSADPTPDVSEGRGKAWPSSATGATSHSSSLAGTPAREHPQSMAGLGLGLPSSFENPGHLAPQTPQRGQSSQHSPRPSPSGFDRSRQIGLGELSTPRWSTFGGTAHAADSSPWASSGKGNAIVNEAMPLQPSTGSRHVSKQADQAPSSDHIPAVPAIGSAHRDGVVQRHSRAISLTSTAAPIAAQRSPSGPPTTLVASPSMPAHSLGGLSSISSLTRDFGHDPTEYMRNLQEMTDAGQGFDSPPYSIEAMSESESSVAHGADELLGLKTAIAQSRSKDHSLSKASRKSGSAQTKDTLTPPSASWKSTASPRSPRIGDVAWSGAETGPFEVEIAAQQDVPSSLGRSTLGRVKVRSTATANADPYELSEPDLRGSFDLNTAIADLLRDDEERRQMRKDLGIESDSESRRSLGRSVKSDSIKSRPQTGGESRVEPSRKDLVAADAVADRRADGDHESRDHQLRQSNRRSAAGIHNPAVSKIAARTRHSSSPGLVLSGSPASQKMPLSPHPSMPGGHASNPGVPPNASPLVHKSSKRGSTASIAHSLLRNGTLPPNASMEESGEAAEALRKLDGIGAQRRRSGSRERPSVETASSRSPRASKSYSRPGSAGKGNSRPSSPATTAPRMPKLDQGSGLTKGDRQKGAEESRQRRASRNLSRPRVDEMGGNSPKMSLDSPTASSFSSPRARKSVLPPLPTSSMSIGIGSPPAGPSINTPLSADTLPTSRTDLFGRYIPVTHAVSRDSASVRETGLTPATTASSRSSSGPKAKRISDASSHHSITGDVTRSDSGMEDDEHRGGMHGHGNHLQSHPNSRTGVGMGPAIVIPPVPPLPKAWEASRSGSHTNMNVLANLEMSKDDASSFHSVHNMDGAVSHGHVSHGPRDASTVLSPRMESAANSSRPPSQSASRKWSFSNLSSALGRSPSAARKRAEEGPVTAAGRPPTSPFLAQGPRAPQASHNDFAQSVSAQPSRRLAEDDSGTGTQNRSQSSVASKGPSPTPARRTPSFFRRRGQETHETLPASPAIGGGQGAQTSKTPPPSAGRSSRKSILGLSSLLRNSTSRKSVQLTAREDVPDHTSTNSSLSASEFGVKVDPQSTPGGSVRTLRRSSLIGRKRGKTLPSSADPPVLVPATLPPMQVTPIVNQPVPRPTTETDPSDESHQRRRLVNSNSAGDLQGSARKTGAQAASSEPVLPNTPSMRRGAAAASIMPTIKDSSPAGGQSAQLFPSTSSSRTDEHASTAGASRIPRATGSIRRTPLRPGVNETASTMTASASMNTRRLSSYGATGLPQMSKSSTTASLASNFGINGSEGRSSGGPANETSSQSAATPAGGNESSRKPQRSTATSDSAPTAASERPPERPVALVSSAVQSILKAYHAAKSSSEAEGALRRARITAYSSALSTPDREALNSVFVLHEQGAKGSVSGSTTDREHGAHAASKIAGTGSTPASPRITRRLSNAGQAPKDVLPQSATFSAASLPRRVRTSVSATSSAARTARETAVAAAKEGRRTVSRSSPVTTVGTPESRSISAASTVLDEEERAGDEEMESYIRRSHAKKLAAGVSQAELDKMLRFPEPEPPSKAYSPRQAEALYGNQLCDYELSEMFEYKQIYYVGNPRAKVMATRDKTANNHGYDDERGDYTVVERDHLAYRYEIVGTLGRGSFGQVLQCKDHKTGRSVAIKLIRNKKRFHHQALVEVKILQNLVQWDPDEQYNVIKMTDSFYFRNHLCISMELLSINLYELIKANSFAGFTTALIRRFTSQVLLSLSLMRQHHVVHCDLKPENILLKHPRKSAIKVIDFGSSCFEHEKVYTYIQSRFYRSPEVILGMNYHTAIDIWSLGCILAELFTGYPLFPGENEQEQLSCIMEILGTPDRYLVDRASRKKLFFDSTGSPRPYVSAKGKRRRPGTRSLGQALKCNDTMFLDFLAKCLVWDPERRIKPEAALRHAWIRSATSGAQVQGSQSVSGIHKLQGPGVHVRQPSLSLRGGQATAAAAAAASGSLSSSTAKVASSSSTQMTPRSARASVHSGSSGQRTATGSQHITGSGTSGASAGQVGASAASRRASIQGGVTGTPVTTLRRSQQQQQQQPVS